jgi:hypothetical protein
MRRAAGAEGTSAEVWQSSMEEGTMELGGVALPGTTAGKPALGPGGAGNAGRATN